MADNLVKIENCNNITECSFNITDGLLNIKYAINGTGKSTIAQSIKLSTEGKSLNELMPFGAKAKKDKKIVPSISALPYKNIVIFDETYLKVYVYQKSELLKNTFDVMIQSQKYNELKEQIDNALNIPHGKIIETTETLFHDYECCWSLVEGIYIKLSWTINDTNDTIGHIQLLLCNDVNEKAS